MSDVKIAVTGGGALLGQGILRAIKLSSLSVQTIAVDVSPQAAGLYWADEAYLVPKAADTGPYVEAIRRLLAKTRPHLLLVGTDVELAALAVQREELQREFGTQILVSSPQVVQIADDKFLTALFFKQNGFAVPMSAAGEDGRGIQRLVETIGFPLIVKPRIGARSYGLSKVGNSAELKWALERTQNAVVQECVGSEDHEYTASGLYFDGACTAVIVMRRDLRDGNTYRAFTVVDEVLSNQVKVWTNALRPHGPANFQFRIDASGTPKVFEINARFSGTTPLRAHAGFNEVEMCVRKLLWNEPVVQPEVRRIAILRHWSETIVDPLRMDAMPKV